MIVISHKCTERRETRALEKKFHKKGKKGKKGNMRGKRLVIDLELDMSIYLPNVSICLYSKFQVVV